MYIRFWKPSLKRRSAAKRLVNSLVMLTLAVGMFTMSLLFTHPVAAATLTQQHTAVSVQAQRGTMTIVPNVLSWPLDDAEHQITLGGTLFVGRVTRSPHCVDVPNTVIAQNPIGGAHVPVGTSVKLTVSSC